MESEKSKRTLGIVFLVCGVTFLSVGLATKLLALWVMAPAFIALGVVFLAVSKKRGEHASQNKRNVGSQGEP